MKGRTATQRGLDSILTTSLKLFSSLSRAPGGIWTVSGGAVSEREAPSGSGGV